MRSGGQRSQRVIDRRAHQSEAAAFVSAAVIGWFQGGPAPIRSVSKQSSSAAEYQQDSSVDLKGTEDNILL